MSDWRERPVMKSVSYFEGQEGESFERLERDTSNDECVIF